MAEPDFQIFLDSIVLFVGQTWFESRLLSKFEHESEEKKKCTSQPRLSH
jgi:hypothetical protein